MKSRLPKVMHPVAGRPLVGHVLATLGAQAVAPVVVVIGPGMEDVAAYVAPHKCVEQTDRLGTGHAVLQARDALTGFTGDVLIVYGDTPFVTAASYARMREARAAKTAPSVIVLGFQPEDPGAYGRLVVGPNGLERIVEFKDASPAERAVRLCNSGIMLVEAAVLWRLLPQVKANNSKGEYYLTDLVALARADGLTCGVVDGDENELLGINSRVELAQAETLFQNRMRRAVMENGATLTDPASVFFAADTHIGQDVEIGPFTVFGPGVTVADNVQIKGFCHIEGASIASGATVGPHARLRPGAKIGPDAHVGNFVEVKNAVLEQGAKVNHLTYIGDARVGAAANVGAGTITANYDGFNKSHTDIGAGASIGSNSVLVAPVKIGDGAIVGAGAVIRKDVPANALALNDGGQVTREGFAERYRATKKAQKAGKKTT
jgi:bifunctional UDP-N-acetylglucosamine pyrophosphorylase/glucosamine-1-phosphate N-acetyltransferase